jgi:ribonuclease HII
VEVKKLSVKKRKELCDIIKSRAKTFGIASASVSEIQEINILKATLLAMKRAVEALNFKPDFLLVDGVNVPDTTINSRAIIKGDSLSLSIAAASILAKVHRDDFMIRLDEKYPQYGFAKHKGYGTREHIAAIKEYGPCNWHRKKFLRKIL